MVMRPQTHTWSCISPYLDIWDGRFQSSGPVHESRAAIDDSFPVKPDEALLHSIGQFLKYTDCWFTWFGMDHCKHMVCVGGTFQCNVVQETYPTQTISFQQYSDNAREWDGNECLEVKGRQICVLQY